MTELTQDRGSTTRLRSGLVQGHSIRRESAAWCDAGGAMTLSHATMPSWDRRTFEKCVRKAVHCQEAPTCHKLTARPRIAMIPLGAAVMASATGLRTRAYTRRAASGTDISAPLYRAANCVEGATS